MGVDSENLVVMNVTDSDFFQNVIRAGRAFRAAKGKNPAKEGVALAEYLRSDKPLGKSERELLAELVCGDWRNSPGTKIVTAGQIKVQKVYAEYLKLRSEKGKKWGKDAAKMKVAEIFKMSIRSVYDYVKMSEKRVEAIEKAKAKVISANK